MNQERSQSRKTIFGRLKLMAAGLALAGIGVARMTSGIQVVRHGNGQPMFSWGLIAGGVVCFVLAVIPLSWIARAVETPTSRSQRRRHHQRFRA
jgi:hypothetical protein